MKSLYICIVLHPEGLILIRKIALLYISKSPFICRVMGEREKRGELSPLSFTDCMPLNFILSLKFSPTLTYFPATSPL